MYVRTCVSMYVCMHVYMRSYIHTYIHTYTHTYIPSCIHASSSLGLESPAVLRYSADTEQSLKKRQMRKQKSDAAVAHFLKELRSYTFEDISGKDFHMLCRCIGITGSQDFQCPDLILRTFKL